MATMPQPMPTSPVSTMTNQSSQQPMSEHLGLPTPMPDHAQKVQQAAQKATQTMTQAASTLPQAVGQVVQQHTSLMNQRNKQIIDQVANAHVNMTAAQDRAQQLQPIAAQIHQHMQELQQMPDSPQKTIQMGYLAHQFKQVVTAAQAASQSFQAAQTTIQAIMAESRNRKILSKAVGYDEKAANTPERQMMVQALQQGLQQIHAGANQQIAQERQRQQQTGYLNPYKNPEDQPPAQAFAFNKQWAKSGPYETQLSPQDEYKFQQWVKKNNVPWQDSPTADYDMRGYWKALQEGKAKESRNIWDGRMHFPDTWKTPYSGSFSNESMYANQDAPHWDGNFLVTKDGHIVANETPGGGAPPPTQLPPGQQPNLPPEQGPEVRKGMPGWEHHLAQLGEVLGTIAAPQYMPLIPGTPQHKAAEMQRQMALEEEQMKLRGQQADIGYKEAQAGAAVPAGEKMREFEVGQKEKAAELAEKEREDTLRQQELQATREATQEFRNATIALQKARFYAQQNPESPQNKARLESAKAATLRAQAAAKTAAEGDEGNQQLAQMLIQHKLAPAELPGFGKQRAEVLKAATKIDPAYNAAQADRAYRYANASSTQNVLNYLESLTGPDNKSGNLGKVIDISNSLPRTKFPPLNRPDLWAKLQAGNPAVASYYAAITETSDQVAKILQGGGSGNATSDAKLKQANDLFNKGFNTDQMSAVASTLRELLGNRKAALIRGNPFLEEQFGAKPAEGSPGEIPSWLK